MDRNSLIQLFHEKGKAFVVNAAKPLVLNKKGVIYGFEKGSVNVFARKKSDANNTTRFFLAHFEKALLFTFGENSEKESYEIFAVSEVEQQVYEISEEDLKVMLQGSEELQKCFASSLDEWVHLLPQNLAKLFVEDFKYSIFPGQTIEISDSQVLSCKKPPHSQSKEPVSWIAAVLGKLALYNNENFLLQGAEQVFPLTSHFFFHSKEKTKVEAVDTFSLVQQGNWQRGLTTFCQFFIRYLPVYLAKQEELDLAILESRKQEEQKNLAKAFKQVESVLSSEIDAEVETTDDPLEQALQILARKLHIQLVFPTKSTEKIQDYVEQIDLICEASHIRKRRVKLQGAWWKQDHGPLLGFYGEEQRPIALIRSSRYRMVDLKTNQVITKEVASQISSHAFMLYAPFPSSLKNGKELIRFIGKKCKQSLWFMGAVSVIGSLIAFFPPIATSLLFDYAVPESSFSLTFFLTIGLLFSAFGYAFFFFLREFLLLKIEGVSANFVQAGFWDRILKISPSFFRKFTVGNLFWRMVTIDTVSNLLNNGAAAQVLSGIFSLFYLIIMSVYAPILTMTVLCIVLFGLVITAICCRLKMRYLRKSLEVEGEIRGNLIQIIGGVAKLRVAAAEKNAFATWASLYAKNTALKMKIQNTLNVVVTLVVVLPILSYLGMYFVMLFWSSAQTISLPNFLAFTVAFGSFSGAVFPLNKTLIDLADIIPFWERTKVILEEPLEQTEEKLYPGKLSGDINLNNVVFGYDPERPPIIQGISLSIRPHEFIGIVGQSGAGKSTLIRLLLGFEKPQSGGIYYDGKDLEKLDVREVRKQLGIVLQGSGIMAGSVYDNIACGGLYEEQEIEDALRLSGFNEVLDELPMGLHTFIQMNGTNLSGGQKQRLLLARALLGSPSILIFDEATSSLDNQSQQQLRHNIEELNVTRICIAQRLSTIQNANRIYVMGHGKILQEGSYEELAKQPGTFSEMLARQSL